MPWQRNTPSTCAHCGAAFLARYKQPRGKPVPVHCSAECLYAARRMRAEATLTERFWARVGRGDPEDCWPWLGAARDSRPGRQYGGVFAWGRWTAAHRVAYILAHGPLPEGLEVLHRCDNPRCVNPAHLWLGTHAQNMHDMVAKGRWSNGQVKVPGRKRRTEAEREARKRANGRGVKPAEWRALVAFYDGRCVCCGARGRLHADHILPLFMGGPHEIENIQPLCPRCHSKKRRQHINYRALTLGVWET